MADQRSLQICARRHALWESGADSGCADAQMFTASLVFARTSACQRSMVPQAIAF